MKKYYAIYPASYGLTVHYLGKFKNFDGASDASDKFRDDVIWIIDCAELCGFSDSIENVLTKSN